MVSSGTGKQQRREIIELPDLLQNLCDARRTGTLVLTGPDSRMAYLYMRDGALAAAFDGDPEFLGKALVKTRALEWEQLAEFNEFFRPTPATLDRLLIEQKRADDIALREAREFVVRELVCEVLTWQRPRSEFHEGAPLPELARVNLPHESTTLPTKPLIMNGVYQLDEWTRVRDVVRSDGDVPIPTDEGPAPEGRSAEVFELVDGERTVSELVALARMSRFDANDELRDLIEKGSVRLLGRRELVELGRRLQETAEPTSETLIAIYERAEELGTDDDDLRLWLAKAREARGDFEEASRRYLQVARSKRAEKGATGALRRALMLRPDDGALQRELIQKFFDEGRMEDAALQLERYVEWLRERGDPIAAYRAARPLLEQLDEFEEMLVLHAELSAESGNPSEATGLYRRIAAIRLDSELSEEFSNEEQVEVLDKVLALEPADLDVRWRLTQLLIEGKSERAAQELQAFVDRGPKDERVLQAYDQLGELQPERSLVGPRAEALLSRGELDQAQLLLASALEQEGDLDDALLPTFEAFHAAQRNSTSHELLARALLKASRVRLGITSLLALGAKQLENEEEDDALRTYELALRHDPYDWTCRSALAELLLLGGTPDAWRENLRALVDIARIGGRLDVAVETLKVYTNEVPGDPAARLELVRLQLQRGGGQALADLRAFALSCVESEDRGLLRWAIDEAKARSAPESWFEGLP